MKIKYFTTAVILLFLVGNIYAQQKGVTYISHYDEPNRVKNYIIIDSVIKTRFILDSARIIVSAIDSSGKKLWQTDPWKDNHINEYRFKRPLIVMFDVWDGNWAHIKNAIWIVYNNSQFGAIDKATGKFTWLGQD
jgi:hypothetical protein